MWQRRFERRRRHRRVRRDVRQITTPRPDAEADRSSNHPSNQPNNVSYNADVASEVKSFQAAGQSVSVVDMYTNFPTDGLYSDGVHPNDKGFAFVSRQWLSGILAALPGFASP